jgi:hypothetical protein
MQPRRRERCGQGFDFSLFGVIPGFDRGVVLYRRGGQGLVRQVEYGRVYWR